MSTQDTGDRQDLVENGVQRELLSIQENVTAPQDLGSAFESEVEHDLIVWPREYLETYLDRSDDGTIPLNEVRLQDLLEATFDRDEELARNAIASLKKAANDRGAATLTVSMDDHDWDRTAHPILVSGKVTGDGKEYRYSFRIENDADRKRLRELLEKTAAVIAERALFEALAQPGATHLFAKRWSAESRTLDLSVFVDMASHQTVANPIARGPRIFDSVNARLRRLLPPGRSGTDNSAPSSVDVNPEFRKQDSRYVSEYGPGAATIRLHDKRSVENVRVVGPMFDAGAVEGEDATRIATEKDLQRRVETDRSSLATGISHVSDSLQGAAGRIEIVQRHRQAALTDSGVYSGKIVSETPQLIIQRISAATEVAHPKSLFAQIPQIGQLVRIAYQNDIASIRELHPRKLEKELAR